MILTTGKMLPGREIHARKKNGKGGTPLLLLLVRPKRGGERGEAPPPAPPHDFPNARKNSPPPFASRNARQIRWVRESPNPALLLHRGHHPIPACPLVGDGVAAEGRLGPAAHSPQPRGAPGAQHAEDGRHDTARRGRDHLDPHTALAVLPPPHFAHWLQMSREWSVRDAWARSAMEGGGFLKGKCAKGGGSARVSRGVMIRAGFFVSHPPGGIVPGPTQRAPMSAICAHPSTFLKPHSKCHATWRQDPGSSYNSLHPQLGREGGVEGGGERVWLCNHQGGNVVPGVGGIYRGRSYRPSPGSINKPYG